MAKTNNRVKKYIKILQTSAIITVIVATVSIIYAFFTLGYFSFAYIFTANFVAGTFIIAAGLIIYVKPARMRGDKLLDHSTVDRLIEQKDFKRTWAYEILYTGVLVVVIAAFVEYVLSIAL